MEQRSCTNCKQFYNWEAVQLRFSLITWSTTHCNKLTIYSCIPISCLDQAQLFLKNAMNFYTWYQLLLRMDL